MHIKLLQIDEESRKDVRAMRTEGKATFYERECWQVYFEDDRGAPGSIFFDVVSKLPLGLQMGGGQTTVRFLDWKPQGGLMLFRRVTREGGGPPMDMVFREIKVNELEESFFALPPEVKELAAARRDAGGGDDGAESAGIKLEDLTAEQQKQATQMLEGFSRMDASQLRQALTGISMAVGMVPESEKKMFEYVLQEANARLKELEGG